MEAKEILSRTEALRATLSSSFRDEMVKGLYAQAEQIARRAVKTVGDKKYDFDQKVDRLVTSPVFGQPIMLLMLAAIIWLTFQSANYASEWIANILFWVEAQGAALFNLIGLPWWITIFVLWRAIQTAAPAGALIWILANINIGEASLAVAG